MTLLISATPREEQQLAPPCGIFSCVIFAECSTIVVTRPGLLSGEATPSTPDRTPSCRSDDVNHARGGGSDAWTSDRIRSSSGRWPSGDLCIVSAHRRRVRHSAARPLHLVARRQRGHRGGVPTATPLRRTYRYADIAWVVLCCVHGFLLKVGTRSHCPVD